MEKRLFDRYLAGEYEAVYDELVALGEGVRDPAVYEDACAVAAAMMARVRQNVEMLVECLRALEYRFELEQESQPYQAPNASDILENIRKQVPSSLDLPIPDVFWQLMQKQFEEVQKRSESALSELKSNLGQQAQQDDPQVKTEVYSPPNQERSAALMRIEERFGPMPITLRAWFDVVGEVDLVGDHPKLAQYFDHSDTGGPQSDPLVVYFDPLNEDIYLDMIADDPEYAEEGFILEISPDACHKSNYSGGSPNGFALPQSGFDGTISSDDEWDGMPFIVYLRHCFAWGGFPGLAHDLKAAKAASEELAALRKDLLAF